MRSWLVQSKIAVLIGISLFVLAACGGDSEEPLSFNECGDVGELEFDGEGAELGEACGPCERGALVCGASGNELVCNDPDPSNDCGGCQDLDQDPSSPCTDENGLLGQIQCDGENAVQCISTETNACGGSTVLNTAPGTICGDCELDSYQCAGSEDTACVESVGCPMARDVSATSGTRSDSVLVTWRGSVFATGYRVYRDGTPITETSGGNLSFSDTEATPPGTPETVELTATMDQTDGVELTWHAEPADANPQQYQVEVLYEVGSSELSESAYGHRGSDVERFELSIDDGDWMDQGTETEAFHSDAAMATVSTLNLEVVDTSWNWLALEAYQPVINPADVHEYKVRAFVGASHMESDSQMGQRANGDAYYEWSIDADGMVEVRTDCADELECVDDDFDGDLTEKEYQFTVSGDGIETKSTTVDGMVDLLMVEVAETASSYEVGDTVEFEVWLVDTDGEPVAREGVEIEIALSDEGVVESVPEPVMTDENGMAAVELTFDDTGDDVLIHWTPVDDARVSDEVVEQGPFDVVLLDLPL